MMMGENNFPKKLPANFGRISTFVVGKPQSKKGLPAAVIKYV